jgi:GMP synthase (glutamine-hydrolysing)
MSNQRPILIVKTGDPAPPVEAKRGPFAKLIQESIGDAWRDGYLTVDARTDPPPDPRSASAILITGSAANVPNRESWMLRTEAWLRDVVPLGVPVLGICFGHQMLAQALGGETIKNPRGREMGTKKIERAADDILFSDVPASFDANLTHLDTVGRLPAGAACLARSSLDDYQVIRFSPTCYGVQYHPEMDADVMSGYINARREILKSEGFDPDAMLAAVNDAELGRRTLLNFVRHIIPRGRLAG